MKKETLEELWLEYRSYTTSEDAWQFKEWLIKQQPQQETTYTPEEVEFIKRAVQQYWDDWNEEHPDNQNDLKLTQQILNK